MTETLKILGSYYGVAIFGLFLWQAVGIMLDRTPSIVDHAKNVIEKISTKANA